MWIQIIDGASAGLSLEDLLLLPKAPNKEDMLRLLPLPPGSLIEIVLLNSNSPLPVADPDPDS